MKTQMVCPGCRGLRSVANFAYPGHLEACPRCEASGYVAVAAAAAAPAAQAATPAAANDIGKLRQLLKSKWDLLTVAMFTPASWSTASEFALCAWM